MNGYITYTDTSELSPVYEYPFTVNGTLYRSPDDAITQGSDPLEVMLQHIRNRYALYSQYKEYRFSGTHSSFLNQAIDMLFLPRNEPVMIDKYIYLIPERLYLPPEFGIPVIRPTYQLKRITENIYQQERAIDVPDLYNLYVIDKIPLYSGKNGSFLSLSHKDQDISMVMNKLQ